MKKFFLLLVVVFLAVCLAGCGSKKKDKEPEMNNDADSTSDEESNDGDLNDEDVNDEDVNDEDKTDADTGSDQDTNDPVTGECTVKDYDLSTNARRFLAWRGEGKINDPTLPDSVSMTLFTKLLLVGIEGKTLKGGENASFFVSESLSENESSPSTVFLHINGDYYPQYPETLAEIIVPLSYVDVMKKNEKEGVENYNELPAAPMVRLSSLKFSEGGDYYESCVIAESRLAENDFSEGYEQPAGRSKICYDENKDFKAGETFKLGFVAELETSVEKIVEQDPEFDSVKDLCTCFEAATGEVVSCRLMDHNPCEDVENSTGEYTENGESYSCGCIDNYLWSDKKQKCLPKDDCAFHTEYPCTDHETGLIWSQKSESLEMPDSTYSYCENMNDGSDPDTTQFWQIPTISMLKTLVVKCENTMTGGVCGIGDENNADSSGEYNTANCSCENSTDGRYSIFDDTEVLPSDTTDHPETSWTLNFSNAEIKMLSWGASQPVKVRCAKCADEGYVWNADSAKCIQKVPADQDNTYGADCDYNTFVEACEYDDVSGHYNYSVCDPLAGTVIRLASSYFCIVTLEEQTDGKKHNRVKILESDEEACSQPGKIDRYYWNNDEPERYGELIDDVECVRTGKGILKMDVYLSCDKDLGKCESIYMYCGNYAPMYAYGAAYSIYNVSYNNAYSGRENHVFICASRENETTCELPENAVWKGASTYTGGRYIKEYGELVSFDMTHFNDMTYDEYECGFQCSEDSGWDAMQKKCVSGKSCGKLDKVAGTDGSTLCKDPATNLMWSPKYDDTMNYDTASAYCENLDLGGHDDWRMPTVSELRTLIINDPTVETGGACALTDSCLDQATCFNAEVCAPYYMDYIWAPRSKFENDSYAGSTFWSSSEAGEDLYWVLKFSEFMGKAGFDYEDKDYDWVATVRCVR